ncbi:MAG: hypothetical protein H6558_21215 [Lewinellaceae bacterium]|nr:hypothetical protein [Lewinellaceae bacterium]
MRQLVAPLTRRITYLFLPKVRVYLLYALFFLLAFRALAFLDNRLAFGAGQFTPRLAILAGLALLLGAVNAWWIDRKMLQGRSAAIKTAVTFGANLLGIALFILASRYVSFREFSDPYRWLFLPSLLLFALPWLYVLAVKAIAGVPRLRYAPYVFESLKDVLAEYRFAEDEDRGIRWVFEGNFFEINASGTYRLQTHLPLDARQTQLGPLFKGVLSLHNHNLVPQRPIHFHVQEGFYGWEFHHCPYWFWPARRRALDPHWTLKRNGIRFRRVSEEERLKSTNKLTAKFRAGTIYVTRSLQNPQP